MKTVNRGWLKKQVQAGKVEGRCDGHYTDDYAFDAANGFGRTTGWKPVRIRPATGFDHDYENFINLWADDFTSKSGKAYTHDDGTIIYYVHSNLSYTLRIVK